MNLLWSEFKALSTILKTVVVGLAVVLILTVAHDFTTHTSLDKWIAQYKAKQDTVTQVLKQSTIAKAQIQQLMTDTTVLTQKIVKEKKKTDSLQRVLPKPEFVAQLKEEIAQLKTHTVVQDTNAQQIIKDQGIVIDSQSVQIVNLTEQKNSEHAQAILWQGVANIRQTALNLANAQIDSLRKPLITLPPPPPNPDRLIFGIPKPTRVQTFFLGVASTIVAWEVIKNNIKP